MDMPDPGAGDDGWVLGHVASACDSLTSPRLRGEVGLYAKRKVRVRGDRSIVGSQFAESAPHRRESKLTQDPTLPHPAARTQRCSASLKPWCSTRTARSLRRSRVRSAP